MGAGPASGQRESGGGVAALGCGAGPGLSESEGNRPAPPPARPRNPLVIPRDNSQVTLTGISHRPVFQARLRPVTQLCLLVSTLLDRNLITVHNMYRGAFRTPGPWVYLP